MAGEWGSTAEVMALSRVLERPIRIHTPFGTETYGEEASNEGDADAVAAPLTTLTAGGTLDLQWKFPADHPGDGGLFLSYDYSATVDNRNEMRFFKLANFLMLWPTAKRAVKSIGEQN